MFTANNYVDPGLCPVHGDTKLTSLSDYIVDWNPVINGIPTYRVVCYNSYKPHQLRCNWSYTYSLEEKKHYHDNLMNIFLDTVPVREHENKNKSTYTLVLREFLRKIYSKYLGMLDPHDMNERDGSFFISRAIKYRTNLISISLNKNGDNENHYNHAIERLNRQDYLRSIAREIKVSDLKKKYSIRQAVFVQIRCRPGTGILFQEAVEFYDTLAC